MDARDEATERPIDNAPFMLLPVVVYADPRSGTQKDRLKLCEPLVDVPFGT